MCERVSCHPATRSFHILIYLLIAIIGLQGFFPLKGQAAVGVGSVEYPASERKRLASLWVVLSHNEDNADGPLRTSSRDWTCPHCQQTNLELLPDPPDLEDEKKWGAGNILGSHENESADSSITEAEHVPTTFFETREQEPRQSSKKPHILLDSAICILLVLLFAIICRRVV